MNSFLIHISSSSFVGLSAKEGLDLALVMATFEQPIDLYFGGEALSILSSNQKPEQIHGKNLSKALPSLEFYDIENIYVCSEDISELQHDNLWDGISILNTESWSQKLQTYECILRF
ncbi:DsrE family protein [Marinomonas sp. 2405UD68-3]|uniref:DsrE family protein n=1 Tax=Marinomonas sp. 2405UD68-3 TaxID=3391835 RepID=UPI0039C913CE